MVYHNSPIYDEYQTESAKDLAIKMDADLKSTLYGGLWGIVEINLMLTLRG